MTSTLWTILIGLGAGCLLIAAGYLIGVARGSTVREDLRRRLDGRDAGLRLQLQDVTRSLQQHETTQQQLETDLKNYLDRLREGPTDTDRIRNDLETLLAPIVERERNDGALRHAVHEVLGPMMRREQLGHDLAHLDLRSGERGELPRLLDDIAIKGGFSTVLLSDDAGLPLAASHGGHGIERLAGLSSLVMLLADRLSREPGPAPLAVVVYDEGNHQLLSRLFDVGGQRLLLTAVATGTHLTPTVLDPALTKIEALLTPVDV